MTNKNKDDVTMISMLIKLRDKYFGDSKNNGHLNFLLGLVIEYNNINFYSDIVDYAMQDINNSETEIENYNVMLSKYGFLLERYLISTLPSSNLKKCLETMRNKSPIISSINHHYVDACKTLKRNPPNTPNLDADAENFFDLTRDYTLLQIASNHFPPKSILDVISSEERTFDRYKAKHKIIVNKKTDSFLHLDPMVKDLHNKSRTIRLAYKAFYRHLLEEKELIPFYSDLGDRAVVCAAQQPQKKYKEELKLLAEIHYQNAFSLSGQKEFNIKTDYIDKMVSYLENIHSYRNIPKKEEEAGLNTVVEEQNLLEPISKERSQFLRFKTCIEEFRKMKKGDPDYSKTFSEIRYHGSNFGLNLDYINKALNNRKFDELEAFAEDKVKK